LITRDAVEKNLNVGGQYANVNDYFSKQYDRGYYVGLDKSLSGKAPAVHYKIGFGGLLRVGFIYRPTPIFSISFGGQCLIVSSGRKNSVTDNPIEVADDFEQNAKVNSILNSTGSLLKAQYGINIGLHVTVVK
jgi:hypothetical protein